MAQLFILIRNKPKAKNQTVINGFVYRSKLLLCVSIEVNSKFWMGLSGFVTVCCDKITVTYSSFFRSPVWQQQRGLSAQVKFVNTFSRSLLLLLIRKLKAPVDVITGVISEADVQHSEPHTPARAPQLPLVPESQSCADCRHGHTSHSQLSSINRFKVRTILSFHHYLWTNLMGIHLFKFPSLPVCLIYISFHFCNL